MKVLLLAGGVGSRLRPYTTVLPKPLMPVGDRPILELLLNQLVKAGFDDVSISVGYLAELIQAYFADGERFGVRLTYVREDKPLGTAGPIRLAAARDEPMMVLNGDILTDLNFAELAEFHNSHDQMLTIATYNKEVNIDLGVLGIEDEDRVRRYTEKPLLNYHVSMGAYCCSPLITEYLPKNERFDLPDLVNVLLAKDIPVRAFHHEGYWLDIGRAEDYEKAQEVEIGNSEKDK